VGAQEAARLRVLLFDGSANPGGAIAELLDHVRETLAVAGVEADYVRLERNRSTGCFMCGECAHKRDPRCARPPEDGLRRCARKLLAADGVVIGSPAYGAGGSPATQRLMAYLERRRPAHGEQPLACKAAAVVVDVRNQRAPHTFAAITEWFRANGMIVVGQARAPRETGGTGAMDAQGDARAAMVRLGGDLAWTLKRLQG